MSHRDDDGDRSDEEGPRGIIRSLLELLQEMEERGEHTRTGHRSGPHTSVDFSVSVGGLSGGDEGGPLGAGDGPLGGGSRSSEPDPEAHVTTRETGDGLVVAADLPGVTADDVETTLDADAGELVIEVRGADAARLPLDSNGWTVVDSRFANGVLEVELRRD